MSRIDWSKAPQGAQYWRKSLGCWYMADGGRAYVFRASSGKWEKSTEFDAQTIEESRDIVKRSSPQAWSGEGLPPVGTVCEYMWNYRERGSEYVTARVIVHDNGKAVVRVVSGEHKDRLGESNGGFCGNEPVWRPIRTLEQIAAEEREKAAKALFLTINWNDVESTWDLIPDGRKEDYRKAIDAGYRKVEG